MNEAVYLKIKTKGDIVTKIDKKLKRFPQMTRIGIRKWGNKLAQNMVIYAKKANIQPFNNFLFSNIKWRQPENSNYGELTMPMYGVMLDRMEPHDLWITKNYGMRLRWAKQVKFNEDIRRKAFEVSRGKLNKFRVRVKPHPFILQAYERSRHNLRRDMREYLIRA